jgi:TonB family protein
MPPLPNGVYDVSQVDVKPRFVHREAPRYPYTQYDEETGPSGEGDIMFTVRADGSISDAIVAKATNPLFGRAALQSILRSRFKPALVSGQPVDCRTLVPILIGSSGFDDVFLIRSNEFGIHAPTPYDPPNP